MFIGWLNLRDINEWCAHQGIGAPTTARFKLVSAASKGTNQLPKLIAGVRFNDGIEVIQMPANHAA